MQSSEQTTTTTPDEATDSSDQCSARGDSSSNGQSGVPQQKGFHYSREELVRISKLPASNIRPAYLKAECFNETTGLWSPWKHEKYDQNGWNNGSRTASTGSTFSTRSGDPETLKTRLGPQNPGNWIRGCDPKMQESKPVTESTASQSNGIKNMTSDLSVPPGLRLGPDKRPAPVRPAVNQLHGDWRSDKTSSRNERLDSMGGRFSHPDFDSRSRAGQRPASFSNKNNLDRNAHYSNNHNSHQRNNYEETPEWMDEPTSKFEMMNLGGFEDDVRGRPEESDRKPAASSSQALTTQPEERSNTPDFERLMKDMLNFTEEESFTEIPVTLPESESGSKSSKWFGGRPEPERHVSQRHGSGQNELQQLLQRANINMNQVHGQQPHLPKVVQSLHEIEAGLRSDPSPAAEDKQAFNKLLDLLSRRSGSQPQQPMPQPQMMPFMQHSAAVPPGRPTSYEIEEMNRQRKLMEAHIDHSDHQQQKGRFAPAFSMVPIQVIRNATATDRRGLLPNEPHDLINTPRAITGSAQSLHRPVRVQPASPFGPEFEMQRQAMMQQRMSQPMGAVRPPAAAGTGLSPQQVHQLQQLQLMNQQLHNLNANQLRETRGMTAAQIQQFLLMRSSGVQ